MDFRTIFKKDLFEKIFLKKVIAGSKFLDLKFESLARSSSELLLQYHHDLAG